MIAGARSLTQREFQKQQYGYRKHVSRGKPDGDAHFFQLNKASTSIYQRARQDILGEASPAPEPRPAEPEQQPENGQAAAKAAKAVGSKKQAAKKGRPPSAEQQLNAETLLPESLRKIRNIASILTDQKKSYARKQVLCIVLTELARGADYKAVLKALDDSPDELQHDSLFQKWHRDFEIWCWQDIAQNEEVLPLFQKWLSKQKSTYLSGLTSAR